MKSTLARRLWTRVVGWAMNSTGKSFSPPLKSVGGGCAAFFLSFTLNCEGGVRMPSGPLVLLYLKRQRRLMISCCASCASPRTPRHAVGTLQ